MRIALVAALSCTAAAVGSGVTTIEVTDKVLLRDTEPFGINLGNDRYYSGSTFVKKRVQENFEGTSYRQCHASPLQDETGAATWYKDYGGWDRILPGGDFTILSGPAKGRSGKIKDITTKTVESRGKDKELRYFVFDRRVPAGGAGVGVLVEALRLREGQFKKLDGYWTSRSNRVEIGDVPPGSFGCAALVLDGTQGQAHVRFPTHYQRYGETNGTWHVRFWAKSKAGVPRLSVGCDRRRFGESRDVELARDWQKRELTLVASNVPEPKSPKDDPMLWFLFRVTGGQVLLDDVEIWMEGDQNPTVFRDDCVEMLKRFKPSVIRRLQIGGSTVGNTLAPILKSHTYCSETGAKVGPYESHRKDTYSLHEMYELCEHLGSDPWYCLPGTLHPEEVAHFMEYLGAPADVGYGRVRAKLGHPKPWTEVFKRIFVEFGDEAWAISGPWACGGFCGRDYWKDLIELGKGSPHCRKNVVFILGGQPTNAWRARSLLKHVPNADRFSIPPYVFGVFNKADAVPVDTDDKLFRWAFAFPIWRSTSKDSYLRKVCQLAKEAGKEVCSYEMNHHITFGDGPLEPRNKLSASVGGAINVVHTMLLMMREHGMRTQLFFNLTQHGYRSPQGVVRLWGAALSMRKGKERYRPTFLACEAVNRVLAGDLVETRHRGAAPTFSATGVFRRRKGVETVEDLPLIWSYAFTSGAKRSLALFNLDTAKTRAAQLKFGGTVRNSVATMRLLTADEITATNEYEEAEPRVHIKESRLTPFSSGHRIALPPFSMTVLSWEYART